MAEIGLIRWSNLNPWNLDTRSLVDLIIIIRDKFSHFEMKEELTEENITRFIKQY